VRTLHSLLSYVRVIKISSDLCQVCEEPLDSGSSHFRILIPLYHSESHLPQVNEFLNQLHELVPGGITVDFIVDGRAEDEIAVSKNLDDLVPAANIIVLSRNFGVGPALHAGLAQRQACISSAIGSDLQEPISLYLDFFNSITSGIADIALGQRRSRKDPLHARVLSRIYWRVNRLLVDKNSPKGGFDVFAMSKDAVTNFVGLQELNTSFTSQLLWIGYRIEWIKFDRSRRISGKSTWTIRRKMKLFADSLYGYTGKPISLMTWTGAIASTIILIFAFLTFLARITGRITLPGYSTLVILFALGQSLTLLSIGIVGGYLQRTFENSTGRPNYIIRKVIKKSD